MKAVDQNPGKMKDVVLLPLIPIILQEVSSVDIELKFKSNATM
jgi:hypothetical protein